MGKLTLVTGGARSGKSTFAEEMVKKYGNEVVYIATSIPFDDEMKLRIKKHREQRPDYWETIEAYKDLDRHLKDRLEGKSAVLLDCITVMVTNIMIENNTDWDAIEAERIVEIEANIKSEISKLIRLINGSPVPFVLVTNEVGMGIVPEYPAGRVFRDIAGRVNQMLAAAADEVYLCISGIPVKIKG
ncbi:MAG: bifunctional adenosylcobinamide kinase/adenosylcobinamide-phosphate guanylyltransferase [Clostridiales bacterium]|jgi:adenosylcobinamide kinase/adenosylcobinamide-phosphate guanylyltransferase|nr:bifunctional adenosylcobinamide kinase/adenosylcobinamide-phosphate guanylyltransferase [Eubacteriales bacterium]MDH7565545.1 bifunctional adenosylcobinamide kinase/adenosylcobinamide-phosphate guanylyltransferase [Clostridiales bacterium]